jgi:hypothetical protein
VSEEKDATQKKSWRERFSRAPGRRRMSPARRKLLLRAGIVALVIIVLAVIPGYIATRPTFMQRYSHFTPEYQSWATSVHAQVPCQRCHVDPGFVAQASYDVRMLGEFYMATVNPSRQPALFPKPTNAACQSCHIDLRTVSPSGDLNIPHRAHVSVLKLDCIKCHAYLVHTTNPNGTHTPAMATCLTCHDGKTAKNACSTCHTNKNEPASHRASDWIVVHPQMQTKVDCASCHKWTANWCSDCHQKRPKSHTADWRTLHGKQVGIRRNCEACHEPAFCIKCHGIVPQLNFNPALRLVK